MCTGNCFPQRLQGVIRVIKLISRTNIFSLPYQSEERRVIQAAGRCDMEDKKGNFKQETEESFSGWCIKRIRWPFSHPKVACVKDFPAMVWSFGNKVSWDGIPLILSFLSMVLVSSTPPSYPDVSGREVSSGIFHRERWPWSLSCRDVTLWEYVGKRKKSLSTLHHTAFVC